MSLQPILFISCNPLNFLITSVAKNASHVYYPLSWSSISFLPRMFSSNMFLKKLLSLIMWQKVLFFLLSHYYKTSLYLYFFQYFFGLISFLSNWFLPFISIITFSLLPIAFCHLLTMSILRICIVAYCNKCFNFLNSY